MKTNQREAVSRIKARFAELKMYEAAGGQFNVDDIEQVLTALDEQEGKLSCIKMDLTTLSLLLTGSAVTESIRLVKSAKDFLDYED
jgi:uncharacterized membrane protein YcaP (DUF421 family)